MSHPQHTAPTDPTDSSALADRIHGAWLGRTAGNMLGKPVETGMSRAELRAHLRRWECHPLTDWVRIPEPETDPAPLNPSWPETIRGRIHGSSRDDDLDYTVLNLHLIEQHGDALTPEHVGAAWLERLPYHQVFTAERSTYRNLVNGLTPPQAATTDNPHQDWIGALIRGDAFGYVHPGDPHAAARAATADASLSHTGTGVHGEQWSAALLAAALTAGTPREAVTASLAPLPDDAPLTSVLTETLGRHAAGESWEQALDALDKRVGDLHWVHTLNNAVVIAAGVLWGDGDYTRTIGLTVEGGLDTDSNGATAGSAAGALLGAAALPEQWTAPLHDTIRTALFGIGDQSITELAARTLRLATARPPG